MAAKSQYYFNHDGVTIGPVTRAEMLSAVQDGTIDRNTPVRKGKDGEWVRAARVNGLLTNQDRQRTPRKSEQLETSNEAVDAVITEVDSTASSSKYRVGIFATAIASVFLLVVVVSGNLGTDNEALKTLSEDTKNQHSVPTDLKRESGNVSGPRSANQNDSIHADDSSEGSTIAKETAVTNSVVGTDSEPVKRPDSKTSDKKAAVKSVASDAANSQNPVAMGLVDLIEKVELSVVRIDVEGPDTAAIGSGFVASETGLIVTNHHVIEGATVAKITFVDGRSFEIEGALFADPAFDIAILQCKSPTNLTAIPISKELPRKGERVAAFGAPKGLDFSASEGIISAVRSPGDLEELGFRTGRKGMWLQTTTPISSGNSGGPLINNSGMVVGINTWTLTTGQNLNFAVSSVDIRNAIDEAKKRSLMTLANAAPVSEEPSTPLTSTASEYTSPEPPLVTASDVDLPALSAPAIGLVVADLDYTRALYEKEGKGVNDFKLSIRSGVSVVSVDPYGPAMEAGFKPGDIITQLGTEKISSVEEFLTALRKLSPNIRVPLRGYSFVRNDGTKRSTFTLQRGSASVVPVEVRQLRLARMLEKLDSITDMKHYSHRSTPTRWTNQILVGMFETKSGTRGFAVTLQYVSDDWLFVRKYQIRADDEVFEVIPSKVNRKVVGSNCVEQYNFIAVGQQLEMLKALAIAKDVASIRYWGDNTSVDHKVGQEERARIREILEAYEVICSDDNP